jgi:hypothetical protein
MEVFEDYAESAQRYSVESVARFVESVVRCHPEGTRWAHLPAIVRRHPERFFYVSPKTRVVDLAASIAAGHASR